MKDKPARHHPLLVLLHWSLALLIVLMLAVGMLVLKPMPNTSPEKLVALRAHMLLGGLILLLMLLRVVVRWRFARPAPLSSGHAALDRLAGLAHASLYLLVFAMALSGIGIAIAAGLPQIVFAGHGSLPISFADLPPRIAHGVLAWMLIALITLHLHGVLYHLLIRRDGLLGRMALGRGKTQQGQSETMLGKRLKETRE